ncbi:extensin-like [Arachis ipaensis]|uniref:extensin-like n=1 Tax=Arachis ipaensis TaxID=130454 RepID=UPI0007AF43F2|nr:extensin-like [Arachis ipaensis]
MRKKTVLQKPPRKKLLKLLAKSKASPSTRSRDQTFTPSPSPPNSPPRSDPMARTKTTPRYHSSAKPTPPPKEPPSKPSTSKPSTSKGKCPTEAELVSEPTQPKPRSVPTRPQRDKSCIPLKSVRELDIDPFAHKSTS